MLSKAERMKAKIENRNPKKGRARRMSRIEYESKEEKM